MCNDHVMAALCGSNYWTYAPGQPNSGAIASWHLAAATIQSHLGAFVADGQQAIRLPINFFGGAADGVNIDPTSGQPATQEANFHSFFGAIATSGFQYIEIALMPQAQNSPFNWGGVWNEVAYQQNWNLVYWLATSILRPLGIRARFDLNNELAVNTVDPLIPQYMMRLYGDFLSAFTIDDTVGFSIDPSPAAVLNLAKVFAGRWPSLVSAHIYRGVPTVPGWGSAYDTFCGVHKLLHNAGYDGPLSVGEGTYWDLEWSRQISLAERDTGRVVHSAIQWPIDCRGRAGVNCNVVPVRHVDISQAWV